MNFTYERNPKTGNVEAVFGAKLLSISDETLKLQNENETLYRPCTVEFEDAEGKTRTTRAIMYEANYQKGVEVNQTYLSRAVNDETRDDNSVLVIVSHLVGSGASATREMFDFANAVIKDEIVTEKKESSPA